VKSTVKPLSTFHLVSALIIGNILEWYGFTVFVQFNFAALQFFPPQSPLAQLIISASMFAVGFILRPLGGIFFSHFGDKVGRLNTLVLSVLLILIPTLLIGLLPSYQVIGIAAPIILILLRLMQGFSAGGEFPGSIAFAVEHASPKHRGLLGSIPFAGAFAGMLLAAIVHSILSLFFSGAQITAWAWRLAFLFSAVLTLVGYLVRKGLADTPVFIDLKETARTLARPVKTAIERQYSKIIAGTFATAIAACAVYLLFIYMRIYFIRYFHLPLDMATNINLFGLLSLTALVPVMGWLSDKVGRKPVMFCGCIGLLIDAYPLYLLFSQQQLVYIVAAQVLLGILGGCVVGPLPALLAEMFPAKIRYSAISLSYNFAFAIFGGFAPLIAVALENYFHSTQAPSLYVMAVAILSTVVLWRLPETHRRPLR